MRFSDCGYNKQFCWGFSVNLCAELCATLWLNQSSILNLPAGALVELTGWMYNNLIKLQAIKNGLAIQNYMHKYILIH